MNDENSEEAIFILHDTAQDAIFAVSLTTLIACLKLAEANHVVPPLPTTSNGKTEYDTTH